MRRNIFLGFALAAALVFITNSVQTPILVHEPEMIVQSLEELPLQGHLRERVVLAAQARSKAIAQAEALAEKKRLEQERIAKQRQAEIRRARATRGRRTSEVRGAPGAAAWAASARAVRLRICESGNRYNAVSKTGKYRGAYQMNRAFWLGYGGNPSITPDQASKTEQDSVAYRGWLARGWQPWPHCGFV